MESSSRDPLGISQVRASYDAVAEDYAHYLPDTRAEAPLDISMIDAFAEAVTAGGAGTVLDAGCGAGRISRYLADRGCRVVGVDLSPGMVAMARRDHPDLAFAVGSVFGLPVRDGVLAGVLEWYSVIHTPPVGLPRILTEAARVLRPGGHLLLGFQSGAGRRDVSAAYRRFGHEIRLERHLHAPEQVAADLLDAGLHEVARLVRRPRGAETEDQAFLLATKPVHRGRP